MPLLLSLVALHHGSVHLQGVLAVDELALGLADPCLEAKRPLTYDLVAEMMGDEVFVQGSLETILDCRCVRCLEPFEYPLRLTPWATLIEIQGEDAVELVGEAVDLTPQIREDSLLALPLHPVCRPDCRGIPLPGPGTAASGISSDDSSRPSSTWSALDTLKLD